MEPSEFDTLNSSDNSGNSAAANDATSLLLQSPFGRLSEVLGTE